MKERVIQSYLLFFLLLPLFFGCLPTSGEEERIGVLHMERLVAESLAAQSFQERLDNKGREIQEEFELIARDLDTFSRSRVQQEYYEKFLEHKRELERELNRIIEKKLESICQELNISVVLDKLSVQQGGIDITDRVIEAIGEEL